MACARHVSTAIIVPARNEQQRMAACFGPIGAQADAGVGVVLVTNNCNDQTVRVARDVASAAGVRLDVLDCGFGPGKGVGTARKIGAAHALALWPGVLHLLTTDADCIVAPDWVARNLFHLGQLSGVCGLVVPIEGEVSALDGMDPLPAEMEGRYERLVTTFYRQFRSGPCGLEGDHGGTAGASLGIRTNAYQGVKGFGDLVTGEDRDLVRRLKEAGFGVRHASDVRVAASCRLSGRAPGGMSDALAARVERRDYLIDEALPPARALIDAARAGTLGPWPLQMGARLHARDLGPQIALLEAALRDLTQPSATGWRQAVDLHPV